MGSVGICAWLHTYLFAQWLAGQEAGEGVKASDREDDALRLPMELTQTRQEKRLQHRNNNKGSSRKTA